MTLNEFFTELGKLRVKWYLSSDKYIRSKKTNSCPIAVLANRKAHKQRFGNLDAGQAGNYLGLTPKNISSIVYAADKAPTYADYNEKLRTKLLKVTGVKELNA